MILNIIEESKLESFKAMIEQCSSVVLTCHKSPDGDAIGSTMGLATMLKHLGKDANVVVPNISSDSLLFLPGSDTIIVCDTAEASKVEKIFDAADLIICMDFNDLRRTQDVENYVKASSAKKVLIDHHLDPKDFCDLTFSFPELSSTCELTYRILKAMGVEQKLGKVGASYLYMGLVTDTGNFAYNSNNPETFMIAAELVAMGVDKDRIYNRALNTQKENSIRLQSYALQRSMKVKREYGVALVTLSRDVLRRYYYTNGDTEGLVNRPLRIPEVFCSVFMREDDSCIKISMRSIGDFSVKDLCERYFNGGGHKNAAAGEFHGTLEDAMNVFYRMLLAEKDNILKHKEIYINKR